METPRRERSHRSMKVTNRPSANATTRTELPTTHLPAMKETMLATTRTATCHLEMVKFESTAMTRVPGNSSGSPCAPVPKPSEDGVRPAPLAGPSTFGASRWVLLGAADTAKMVRTAGDHLRRGLAAVPSDDRLGGVAEPYAAERLAMDMLGRPVGGGHQAASGRVGRRMATEGPLTLRSNTQGRLPDGRCKLWG